MKRASTSTVARAESAAVESMSSPDLLWLAWASWYAASAGLIDILILEVHKPGRKQTIVEGTEPGSYYISHLAGHGKILAKKRASPQFVPRSDVHRHSHPPKPTDNAGMLCR